MLTSPARPLRGAQAARTVRVERRDVPVEAIGQLDRLVGEAVHLVRSRRLGPDATEDHATARGAEIDRDDGPESTGPRSPQEGGGYSGVDRDVEAGRLAQVAADEGEDRGCHVLGQDLLLQQRALGVELAELVLGDTVDRAPGRRPSPWRRCPSRGRRRRG